MLVGASPATQGSGPKHLLSSPLAPGGQGSRPHLFGACDSMPFPSSPLLLVSACPFSTCPQPVLTSLSPSCKLLWSAALVLLGLLLSHQGLYADNLILLPRLIQLTLARTHTYAHNAESTLQQAITTRTRGLRKSTSTGTSTNTIRHHKHQKPGQARGARPRPLAITPTPLSHQGQVPSSACLPLCS